VDTHSLLADKPDLQPRKDYDDYTSYINDSYADDKQLIINKAKQLDENRRQSVITKRSEGFDTTPNFEHVRSSAPEANFRTVRQGFSTILKAGAPNFKKQTMTHRTKSSLVEKGGQELEVKPRILESRIS
jgi:hypothetical protein